MKLDDLSPRGKEYMVEFLKENKLLLTKGDIDGLYKAIIKKESLNDSSWPVFALEEFISYFIRIMSGSGVDVLKNVNSIKPFFYYENPEITSIVIPENITTIDKYAFSECNNLKEVKVLGPVTVKEYAFSQCINLEEINLSKVVSIKSGAFDNCRSLTSITLSSSLTDLGDRPFTNLSAPLGKELVINCPANIEDLVKSVKLPKNTKINII